ncbi:MAG: hypothetical protein NVV62_06010 [Terricaulis sp.]|nr:hypothetical protein [Terricaulis sp.]
MTHSRTGADSGDLSVRFVLLLCLGLYAVYMASALLIPHELLWQGPARHPVTGEPNWEFGLAETSQNIFLAIALVMSATMLARSKSTPYRIWMGVVFLGVLYLLGEETSWGQHYFRWGVGGWFADNNDQLETNLHNTSALFDQLPRNVLYLGMVAGGIVHPLLKWARKGRGLIDNPWWWAPTLASLPPVVFAFIAGAPKSIDKTLTRLGVETWVEGFRLETFIGRASEMEECFMYFFFVIYLWSLMRRLKARAAAG